MRGEGQRTAAALLVLALAGAALTACSTRVAHRAGVVSVVASTDVYGDIVAQIAGRLAGTRIAITSIIAGSTADPHSYEASARTELALARADVVIENGGGYDDFMDALRRSAGGGSTLLDAVDISGHRSTGGTDLNEHVWYDFPTVARLATRLTAVLVMKDPADAAELRANAARFLDRLRGLERTEARIRAQAAGRGVLVTEPVPLYLLQACGLVNRTPPAFSRAVEDGTEVAPRVLRRTLRLESGPGIAFVAYNEQAVGRDTEQLLATARRDGTAVVPVTETLPDHRDYLAWMAANLSAVAAALDRA